MFSKLKVFGCISVLFFGFAANAETYFCSISDSSHGKADIRYDASAKTVKIRSKSVELNQFVGLKGSFAATLIDPATQTSSMKDNPLIQFRFSEIGFASIRFFRHKLNGVIIAEFIPSEQNGSFYKVADFVLSCCVGNKPGHKGDNFACK